MVGLEMRISLCYQEWKICPEDTSFCPLSIYPCFDARVTWSLLADLSRALRSSPCTVLSLQNWCKPSGQALNHLNYHFLGRKKISGIRL